MLRETRRLLKENFQKVKPLRKDVVIKYWVNVVKCIVSTLHVLHFMSKTTLKKLILNKLSSFSQHRVPFGGVEYSFPLYLNAIFLITLYTMDIMCELSDTKSYNFLQTPNLHLNAHMMMGVASIVIGLISLKNILSYQLLG